MKKALIIGGNGFVGGHMVMQAKSLGYLPAVVGTGDAAAIAGVEYYQSDIGNYEDIARVVEAFRPDLCINTAAMADIDRAEQDKPLAERINVLGAANGARAAAAAGAKYCWLSSDAVYDGLSSGYAEDSPLAPVNYYGRTKMLGEEAVLAANPDALIPRLSLVLGFPLSKGNPFLTGLHARLSAGQAVTGFTYQKRTPVDVLTLCEAVFELAELDWHGIIHIGATSSIDRYELARKLAIAMGYNPSLVLPLDTEDNVHTPRHVNGTLSVDLALRTLKHTKLCTVDETVQKAVSTKNK